MGFGIEGQYGEMWVTYDPLVRYTVTFTRPDTRLNTDFYQTYIKDKVGMPQTPPGDLLDPGVMHPYLSLPSPTKAQLQSLKPKQGVITFINVYPSAVFGVEESLLYNVETLYAYQLAEWADYNSWQEKNYNASVWNTVINQEDSDPEGSLQPSDVLVVAPMGDSRNEIPPAIGALGESGDIVLDTKSAYRISVGVDAFDVYATLTLHESSYSSVDMYSNQTVSPSPLSHSIGVSSLVGEDYKYRSVVDMLEAFCGAIPPSDMDQFTDLRFYNSYTNPPSVSVSGALESTDPNYGGRSVSSGEAGFGSTWSSSPGGGVGRYLSLKTQLQSALEGKYASKYPPSTPTLSDAITTGSSLLFRSGHSNYSVSGHVADSWDHPGGDSYDYLRTYPQQSYWHLIDTFPDLGTWLGGVPMVSVYGLEDRYGVADVFGARISPTEVAVIYLSYYYKYRVYCISEAAPNAKAFPPVSYPTQTSQYYKYQWENHTLGVQLHYTFKFAKTKQEDPEHTRYIFSWRLQ